MLVVVWLLVGPPMPDIADDPKQGYPVPASWGLGVGLATLFRDNVLFRDVLTTVSLLGNNYLSLYALYDKFYYIKQV